jgi:hypothetical protein
MFSFLVSVISGKEASASFRRIDGRNEKDLGEGIVVIIVTVFLAAHRKCTITTSKPINF